MNKQLEAPAPPAGDDPGLCSSLVEKSTAVLNNRLGTEDKAYLMHRIMLGSSSYKSYDTDRKLISVP